MQRQPIVIYGAGGFAREVLALVRDVDRAVPSWDVLGFLDDDPDRWGQMLNDLPVLGGADWLARQSVPVHTVLGIGSPVVKRRVVERICGDVAGFPTLVHPTVCMSQYVHLGLGVLVAAGNILTVNIDVRDFAMINLACTIGHDAVIGAFASLAPGVNVSGQVAIGDGCELGTGGAIVQGVTIGEWAVTGAGAVVAASLPANCTAVGVPARVIKERARGWHLG